MDKLFLQVLNMSLTGSFVILAICLIRLPLKRVPKIISYCMWLIVGFRLICPFSIESVFSLIPFKSHTIPSDIAMQAKPQINSGILAVNHAVSRVLPEATNENSVNPLQTWITVGTFVWMLGMIIMLVYGVASFIILKRKMKHAVHLEGNIYEDGDIQTPFVLGIIKPQIYLPTILTEQERGYIILHEQTHIRRYDHIVKIIAYALLCLHWFNPLAWVAFLIMGVDMEMSCDERVLKEMGGVIKKDYSMSLLSLGTKGRIIGGSPIAFGEGGIKERIKNILKFKKPSRVVLIVSVALVAVLGVGLTLNKNSEENSNDKLNTYIFPNEKFNEVFFQCNDSPYNPEYITISAQLMNNQNLPELTCETDFILVKLVGDTWEVVPFAEGVNLENTTFRLENGMSLDYSISPDMVKDKLEEGQYRIVTNLSYQENGSENLIKQTVWADFTIDKDAKKQESIRLMKPSENPLKTYELENASKQQIVERLSFVSLYMDGKAWLQTPPISSYLLPECTYSYEEDTLVIYANIKTKESENFFGVKDGSVLAKFKVIDENTIVFLSGNVPLFADEGARYISTASTDIPNSDFQPREWVNYYNDKQISEDPTLDLKLDEFPGVTFHWNAASVTATSEEGEKELLFGMPIWNVYLADLNGDTFPEFCATISFGSGIIDNRILVYDYVNNKLYDLSDRMIYDYVLSLKDGQIVVTQYEYRSSVERGIGSLGIVEGELVLYGIDRTKPTKGEE